MDRVHELMKLYYRNGYRHKLGCSAYSALDFAIVYEIKFFKKKKPLAVLQVKNIRFDWIEKL